MSKKKQSKSGGLLGRIIRRFFLLLFTIIILLVVGLALVMNLVFNGPSPAARDVPAGAQCNQVDSRSVHEPGAGGSD